MSQSIQPLRIQKGTPLSSPSKMNGVPVHRPLSELGPVERRRNSPSYNQASKKMMFNGDSSPFDSSPFGSNSSRLYWQNRQSPTRFSAENRDPRERDTSPSPAKRSSIENLKRASRVKNSNMFVREHNREYDPTSSPMIERPLASGRPLSKQTSGVNSRASDIMYKHNTTEESRNPISSPTQSPLRADNMPEPQKVSSKEQSSPTKSSLSSRSRYAQAQTFDPENGTWSEEEDSIAEHELPPGKSLHRHAKSVTFDAAPPQVNEYEMTTPDPSSVASGSRDGSYDSADDEEDDSFNQGSPLGREDSFDASLEDTDKTPVVLPDDWRFMSPEVANGDLAAQFEDPFDGEQSSPAPAVRPSSTLAARPSPTRTDSNNSSGERRPLPPVPGLAMPMFPRARSDSNNSLSAVAERVSSAQRTLPSPPRPASITKSEIQGLGGCSMPIEDRLRLMMIQDEEKSKTPAEEQRERRLRRGLPRETHGEYEQSKNPAEIQIHEDEVEKDEIAPLGEYHLPPRISRESILRKVKLQNQHGVGLNREYFSPTPASSPGPQMADQVDPDTPLPSLEDRSVADDDHMDVVIKREDDDEDSEVDVYAIPELYNHHIRAESDAETEEEQPYPNMDAIDSWNQKDDDEESHYSNDFAVGEESQLQPDLAAEDEGPATPRANSLYLAEETIEAKTSHRMSLPQFASMLGTEDFGLGLQSYLTPSPPLSEDPVKSDKRFLPDQTNETVEAEQVAQRPVTPEEQLLPPRFPGQGEEADDEPRTPDSVIRHPAADSPSPDSPSIPEPVATIKAPGGKLKTRPSLTPSDAAAMAETRRQVSTELPAVPPIPARHRNRPSLTLDSRPSSQQSSADTYSIEEEVSEDQTKQVKRKSSLVQLEVPVGGIDDGLSFGLDREFDRVIEAQKVAFALSSPTMNSPLQNCGCAEYMPGQGFTPHSKTTANKYFHAQKGYLMRQNTKMVVASSASNESAPDKTGPQEAHARGTRSAGNSPRKASQTKTWTTEPWNGKIRRKSVRRSQGGPHKKPPTGPAPPLPGQSSNVTNDLASIADDESIPSMDEAEEGGERGRLFVKVVGVKHLDLPLPKGERSYFALTLDNGLHCVTTSWLELGKNAPIGQEFELVVLNDLEFQLTLQTKLEEPKVEKIIESPTKTPKASKTSAFSRVFTSPKKRKEMELKQQEEAQRAAKQKQQEAQKRRSAQPTAWDLLHNLVARDGSFARSYVCLKDHESRAYGRPYTVDLPCFNEWALEDAQNGSSVKSKRSALGGGAQRKAPYQIGKLELQLLFVPKPKSANEEDMPKSMNACIRELKEAENVTSKSWEGHLSQQGGDCPYWRRRFFKLEGSKFTAYHEATGQPRATINLAKASKLIDDKSTLTQRDAPSKGGSRRRSAFAEEEEGYMFVEEGFRIRFANGETIDFYADSAAEKDGWMKVLADVVGKGTEGKGKTWIDMVRAREKSMQAKREKAEGGRMNVSSKSVPNSPVKSSNRQGNMLQHQSQVPPPVEKSPRHMNSANAIAGQQRMAEKQMKTRSMIF